MLYIETDERLIKLKGDLTKETIPKAYYLLKEKNFVIDLKEVTHIDYEGALFLYKLSKKHKLHNINESIKPLFEFVSSNAKHLKIPKQKTDFLYYANQYLEEIIEAIKENTINFLLFFGEFIYFVIFLLTHPWKFRFKETAAIIVKAGAGALPIVGLTSFLIGVVMAYQGAMQLSQFGANIFIVDMIDISMFREIAPLIAAIIVAGRSASSFSAEIGVMKLTEEIDAMKTLGFEPFWFLVIPRVAAMVIAMPLIAFFADVVGVFGGMIISKITLGISLEMFITRTKEVLSLTQVIVGLAKAPFFGIVVALIGTYRGFQVKNSTQDIGKYTTKSVVNAIFWVIALDALFSIILSKFGI
ncbi:MAG: ABC transporter permease [Epsilonproteobacteria bacterium]|nr:ABC transporter permease [Campylobacterota bacterium]